MDSKTNPTLDEATLRSYVDKVRANGIIDPQLFEKYNVKRGLRNADGTGVLVGLTRIGNVHGYIISESEKVPVQGQLFYRGINVSQLVQGYQAEGRFGFEECAYLLLSDNCRPPMSSRGGTGCWPSTAACRMASRKAPSSVRPARIS
jgi:hypothetical protein